MESKCPKCGAKLPFFYLKQTCPKCGTNLLYYDFDRRLEEDNREAIRQEALLSAFIGRLKLSSIGGAVQIIRLAVLLLPIFLTLLPVFRAGEKNLSLLSFIIGLVGGSLNFGQLKGGPALLYPFLYVVLVVLLSLAAAIASLFSTGKSALVRNILFSSTGLAACLILTVLAHGNGALLRAGAVLIPLNFALSILLHKLADRRIRAKPPEKRP